MTPAIRYPIVEEELQTTAECRQLAARLREAKELLEDANKEFTRLDGQARNLDQEPDVALWKRINEWLGE